MKVANIKSHPEGNAYGRPTQTYDSELVFVGPGTPGGEYLRRYWHPVAVSKNVTTRPQEVRILGEDLILFRDGRGRPGLLLPRCAHRGTSLFYGKVDDEGIRCCYHGWQFDVQGRCIDQPCEPERGLHRDKVRQPWYPVEERYGLVFAYMGPPDKTPDLPRWDIFEDLPAEVKLFATDSSFSVGGDDSVKILPWNWLQDWENTLDPFHVQVLHSTFTATQFAKEMAVMPKVSYEMTEHGIRYTAYRQLPDGRELDRRSPAIFPNIISTPDVHLQAGLSTTMGWVVPVDDTHHRRFHVMRVPADSDPSVTRPRQMYTEQNRPKRWIDMTEEERQQWPSDWEAQCGQGPITLHSEEHLGTTDQGIAMLRRLMRKQIRLVQEGKDPIGVSFGDESPRVVGSGNFFRAAESEVEK
ncbi:Rieske 2Fe-2S domain-containing protein [Neopusillimonas maritima]|nr:Rieske 2Fe-2S domain-containing protein [Neopusillimonas maritima]